MVGPLGPGRIYRFDQLLALLDRDARLRTSDEVVDRLPWLYRLMDADGDEAREEILFAEPAQGSAPAPGRD